jgi:hypothetical protein
MERMALEDAAQTAPGTLEKTVFPQRLERVLGTARVETTTAGQERRKAFLVETDQVDAQPPHATACTT